MTKQANRFVALNEQQNGERGVYFYEYFYKINLLIKIYIFKLLLQTCVLHKIKYKLKI